MNSSLGTSCHLCSSSGASSDYDSGCSSCSLLVERGERVVESKNDPLITSLDHEEKMSREQQGGLALECRDFYARRVQSLERFRHRCQKTEDVEMKKEEQPDTSRRVFARLQSDMVSLMESDVSLTRQLLALGERIEELKSLASIDSSTSPRSEPCVLSAASSMVSLDGIDEEDLKTIDDDSGVTLLTVAPLAASCSDDGDGEDEDELPDQDSSDDVLYAIPQKQYFSRQNSVLRIPIPPSRRRSSRPASSAFRSCSSIIKRASNGSASTTSSSDGDGMSSGLSTVSSSYLGWHTRKRSTMNNVDRVRVVSAGSMISTNSGSSNTHHHQASQGSCDSGIHHLNNSLEVLDKEELAVV